MSKVFNCVNPFTEYQKIMYQIREILDHKYIEEIIDAMDNATNNECISNITKFIIGENHIYEIPSNIYKLKNLTHLVIDSYFGYETKIPSTISELKYLNSIYINYIDLSSDNNMSDLSILKKLTNIREFTLSSVQLSEVPNWIQNFSNLELLNLGNNKISKIPDFIFEITTLKTLSFYRNNISIIPNNINKLTNLRLLSLNGNNITRVPDIIYEMIDTANPDMNLDIGQKILYDYEYDRNILKYQL